MEIRVPYETVKSTLLRILEKYDFPNEKALLCSELFVRASLDGISSHGLDRFPVFLNMVRKGCVVPSADPEFVFRYGVFERWNGKLGPGPSNAHFAMQRAIDLAQELGVGIVALQHTNHWMRAGNYGLQAADAGCIGICFTNTKPNMPAWGGSEPKLGNNPLVVAIPRKKGIVLLDMAMSQFSYGRMNIFLRKGEQLPFDAGFDQTGKLSKDPAEIIENELALPVGLWKGAGLSLVLDMLASMLSGGNATHEVGKSGTEFGLSQVFFCLHPQKLGMEDWADSKLDLIIRDFKSSRVFEGKEIRYPGEKISSIREQNLVLGVPVDEDLWKKIIKELE
ncbi:3-dehydro-L-gulonate 2-dehydrogenase [Cecembia calidifontis]|jgi:3-dehydro-L-gulonate 2-dehydrogenase|uniref:3-dehydro-L-gulonate 2-dehydrogenase n=1 Tax=Cecembia calidifontis TaxID=1187080 RepID=A0A4Q7PBI2_9BACT|nr:3-dehydro-L-gulonate 2-dehydrogenase [Cecembia calidifontis]RZS97666.1 3-dehydro-L-gulonate 2-dehydrogenase [Cecembia calidifontis]